MTFFMKNILLTRHRLLPPSAAGVHGVDGPETRPLRQPLCFCHHRVPDGALRLLGSHAADVAGEQEAGTAAAALLCCSCWSPVTG